MSKGSKLIRYTDERCDAVDSTVRECLDISNRLLSVETKRKRDAEVVREYSQRLERVVAKLNGAFGVISYSPAPYSER